MILVLLRGRVGMAASSLTASGVVTWDPPRYRAVGTNVMSRDRFDHEHALSGTVWVGAEIKNDRRNISLKGLSCSYV
jgi:hypothetical protein